MTSMTFSYIIVQGSINVICLATLGTPKCKMTPITFSYMTVQGSINDICLLTLGTPK